MYAGKIVEEGDARAVFEHPRAPVHARPPAVAAAPRHPQVAAGAVDDPGQPAPDRDGPADLRLRRPLPAGRRAVPDRRAADRRGRARSLDALSPPRPDGRDHSSRRPSSARTPSTASQVLSVAEVSKTFHQSGHDVPALVKVNLELFDGETLGLVGESGSGKSTLARTILGIERPDAGGRASSSSEHALAPLSTDRPTDDKRSIQMVFQNPDSALNRGWTARHILQRSVSKLTGLQGQGRRRAGRQAGRRPAADPAPPRPQAAPAVGRAEAAAGDRARVRGRPAGSSSPTSRRAPSTSRSRPRS